MLAESASEGHVRQCTAVMLNALHASVRGLTKQFEVVLGMAAGPLGNPDNSTLLLQQLEVVGVQLLLSHAVHHSHELLDANLTLLLRALQTTLLTCCLHTKTTPALAIRH